MCAVGILTSCFSQSVGVIKSRADTLVWRRLVANQTAECRNYGFYGTGEEKEPFYRHHCCGFVVVSTLNNLKRKWWYWNFKKVWKFKKYSVLFFVLFYIVLSRTGPRLFSACFLFRVFSFYFRRSAPWEGARPECTILLSFHIFLLRWSVRVKCFSIFDAIFWVNVGMAGKCGRIMIT